MFYKVLLAVLGSCVAFEMKCPEPSQWSIRARLHCLNPSLYYCLLSIDGKSRINLENCSKVDFEAPGKRILIRLNFDALYCTNDKYQPIKYWTNVSSDCLFLTSTCTEEGQVLHSIHQYHEYDTSCRCEYSAGYEFVTRPKNQLFCIPSEEDCSCYKKRCSVKTSTLSRDYDCIEEIQKDDIEVSTVSNTTRFATSDVILLNRLGINNTDLVYTGNNGNTHAGVAVFVIIIISICIGVVLLFCGIKTDVIIDKYCRKVYFITQLNSTIECIEGKDQILECRLSKYITRVKWSLNGCSLDRLDQSHYEILQTCKINSLTIRNVNPTDEGEYVIQVNDVSSHSNLKVQKYFRTDLQNKECIEGDNVCFSCEILEADMIARWSHDGAEVKTYDKYTVTRQGSFHQLCIANARLDDSGEYCVQINNCQRKCSLTVREIPNPIKQLSEKDKRLYLDIIRSGTEIRYFIRIIIIGENKVGKTCLLRRLLGQTTIGVQSTDGIDIRRCKIQKDNGKWIFDEATNKRKDLISRLQRCLNAQTTKQDYSENDQGNSQVNDLKLSQKILQSGPESHNRSRESLNDILRSSENSMRKSDEKSLKDSGEYTMEEIDEEHNSLQPDSLHLDDALTELTSQNIPTHPNVQRTEIDDILNERILPELTGFLDDVDQLHNEGHIFVDCTFWDFAGEKEYYPTHSIFLNPNALHLLVANITNDIKEIKTDYSFNEIGEYLDFWFDSVHSCGDPETERENNQDKLNPQVILVCTNIDKCAEKLIERKEKFSKKLSELLEKGDRIKHLVDICYISNTESSQKDFDELRNKIFEIGKTMKTFGEKLPLKWIRMERALDILREAGCNTLSWSNIAAISSNCSITEGKEIDLFLKYQHKVGNIIYFEKFKDTIILSPKWLADALKCLVTAQFPQAIQRMNEWGLLLETGELQPNLIVELFKKEPDLKFREHAYHILHVMEMFGIIIKGDIDGESSTYYMPNMITATSTVETIKSIFNAATCKRTPWLCFEFDFMPLDIFNQIMCYYIGHYQVCTDLDTGRKAIYHGIGVFFLNKTKFQKLIVCFCKNTIAIQIWEWEDIEKTEYKAIIEELKSVIRRVKTQCEPRKLNFVLKTKCPDGDIHIIHGRYSCTELLSNGEKYFCEEHASGHPTTVSFQTWFDKNFENFLQAATTGDIRIVEDCLHSGSFVNCTDENGMSPLLISANSGHREVAAVLISWRADINIKNINDKTPLHLASERGYRDMAALLISSGADINMKDIHDKTPLHLASERGHRDMAALLISSGADINMKDIHGKTAKDVATTEVKPLFQNRTDTMKKKSSALVVVAIDFGTTYSGYAYSFPDEYKKDHTKIYSNNDWKSGDGLVTSKTPTVILFDKDKKFSKFGYEAETKYHTLQEDDEAEGWRYFRRFKMRLFREEKRVLTKADKITKDLQVEDEQGKPMSAMVVISESIKYLKDHFLKYFQSTGFKLEPGDVHFVLTVPAIWEDRAKQFMRESAKMAGIPDEMLTLVYEPEAAAIYCKELTVQKKEGADSSSVSSFEPGQQFMVVDCGGGTVDITAYQIQNDGDLRELERPTGGPWGGTYVDKQYITFLQDLFGRDVWGEYALEDPEDVLEIERRFESKKKSVHATADDQITIPFPYSLFTKYQLAKKYSSVKEGLKKSRYADSVKVKNDRLRFDHQLVKAFFKNPVDSIVKHIKYLLNESQLSRKDIRTILMVGGFSDSSVLSERIIAEFKKYNVICPKDAVNAIMKGAVIFGHNPNIISERISPRTYGISVNKPFNDKVHPDKLKMYYDGRALCTDIFQPIVQIGHPITVGKTVFQQKILPTRATDTKASIEIYESASECPMYTIDKGVRRLGDLTVSFPDVSKGKNRPIIIEVSFGYTEIKVRAYEEGTNNETEATFNCLFG